MEKLLELLNERIKEGWKPYGDDYSITKIDEIWKSDGLYFVLFVGEDYPGPVNLEHLLTKQAGLIKWLVENDKIDFRKLDYKNIYMSDYGSSDDIFLAYNKGEQGIIYSIDYYETILMILAISDTPIEDLISYLK